MTPEELMAKAEQAAASAKILLDSADPDGACNRAYYAMFDASRAALLGAGTDLGKTHRGVLNAFSDRFIKNGSVPPELGRLLKQAETVRYVADYEGDPIDAGTAKEMVERAETFIRALKAALPRVPPSTAGH
ncbi:MAG: HEPN domain-containing protein [Steroidobacteraceae bacterium]